MINLQDRRALGLLSVLLFASMGHVRADNCNLYIEQKLLHEKKEVGSKSVCYNASEGTIKENTTIEIKYFMFRYSLEAKDTFYFQDNGLVRHLSKVKENRKRYIFDTQVKPESVEIEVIEGDKSDQLIHRKPDYEFTLQEALNEIYKLPAQEKTFTVFDLEDLDIEQLTLQKLGDDIVDINGKIYPVKKLQVSSTTSNATVWLYQYKHKDFVLREQGEDQDGNYELMSSKLSINKP